MRILAPLSVPLLLQACSGDCRAPTDLLGGAYEGVLDGEAWAASDATWTYTGEQVLIGHTMADGVMMSMVVHTAIDSQPVVDLLDREELPFEVLLGEGEDGGWVTIYRDGSTSSFHTQNAAGGSVTFAELEGDQLLGCIQFDAATKIFNS